MALRRIIKFPDPVLKQRSAEVTQFDDALKTLVTDMAETMYTAPGVGLAAVQIGVLKRVLVLDAHSGDADGELEVFINPVIVSGEGDITWDEGCLSLPDFSEQVKRKKHIKVRFQDVTGAVLEKELEEFRAVILQHELDHLDGVLATDRISRLKKILYQRKRTREAKAEAEEEASA